MRRKLLRVAAFASCGLLVTLVASVLGACLARPGYAGVDARSREDLHWALPYVSDRLSAWQVMVATGPGLSVEWCWEMPLQRPRFPWSSPPEPALTGARESAETVRTLVSGLWKHVHPVEVARNMADLFGPPNAERISAGWPLPAFRGCLVRRFDLHARPSCAQPRQTNPPERHDALPISMRFGAHTIKADLPTRPVWAGIAFDTVFYAGVLWLLVRFPGTLRRAIRVRRGLCPVCAYPAGLSPVCTECGGVLRPGPLHARTLATVASMARRLDLRPMAFVLCGLFMSVLVAFLGAAFGRPSSISFMARPTEEMELPFPEPDDRATPWILALGRGLGVIKEAAWEPGPGRVSLEDCGRSASNLQRVFPAASRHYSWPEVTDITSAILWQPNLTRISVGWPLPAFRGCVVHRLDMEGRWLRCGSMPPPYQPLHRHGMLVVRARSGGQQVDVDWPIEPIWVGLTVDSVLYACGLWLLTRLRHFLPRAVRARRGLCLACAYPIGVSPVCTECGRAVPRSSP